MVFRLYRKTHVKNSALSDVEIVEKIAGGDNRGWEALYNHYASSMNGIVCLFTHDVILRDELLLYVFGKLKDQGINCYKGSSLSVYLCSCTFNLVVNKLREKGIRPAVGEMKYYPKMLQFLCTINKVDELRENTHLVFDSR